MVEMSEKRFGELVSEAIDLIPDDLFELIDNVVFLIEDRAEDLDLLGLYDGIPLTERSQYGSGELPDRIFLYRLAICAMCEDEDDVVDEVITTVIHEVAHHFGIDDDELDELGWS